MQHFLDSIVFSRRALHLTVQKEKILITSVVAAGFGRHGMPPTAYNPDLWP